MSPLYFLINSLGGGGAEKVVIKLAKYLKPKKIFLLERDVDYKFWGNVQILSYHSKQTNPLLKTLFIPFYKRKLEKLIEKNSIILSFLERANFVNILLGNSYYRIVSIRQSIVRSRKFLHPYNFLIKKLYPQADLIITNSKALEWEVKNYLNISNIKTIYNPVEVEEIKRRAQENLDKYEFLKNFPFLITVGRLTRQKGQWYLLRIFKYLKIKNKDLKLIILGEGELKEYLIKLSQNLDLKTYVWDRNFLDESYDVYFLGFQENPYKFVKYSKAFIFTSLWEGLPNVLIETLAVGKTIISTDCRTGPREILAPSTDFLYETREPQKEEYGILMPNFERKFLKASDPLTSQEKIWIDTLFDILENEKLLKNYELKAPFRVKDFNINQIVKEWLKVINI
jgi:glycosyltransferase involved in cell wall biosynthesis